MIYWYICLHILLYNCFLRSSARSYWHTLKNYFEFENNTYPQIYGTAVGTRYVPSYEIIFAQHWSKSSHMLYEKTKDLAVIHWWRIHDMESLLRRCWPIYNKLKLIWSYNKIHKRNECFWTCLPGHIHLQKKWNMKTKEYHKTTDNKYLLCTSCHLVQHKNSITNSLLVWAKGIFKTEARSIVRTLRTRKYPDKILEAAEKVPWIFPKKTWYQNTWKH